MSCEKVIQVAANAPGWGHWTRVLALATYLPDYRFDIYHRLSSVPIPPWLKNVRQVNELRTNQALICEHGWESARPYNPEDFTKCLCIRKASRLRPDMVGFDKIITVSDIDQDGDYPPVVLETKASKRQYASHVIASSEIRNNKYLSGLYPDYSKEIIFPITVMRNSIQHLAGIAGYNLFWECAYYQIPCTLYRSTWANDSHRRLERLGKRPMPSTFENGASKVASALLSWWLSEVR